MKTEGSDLTTKIGLRLRAARNTTRLTLQQLADITGGVLSKSRISNYEQGLRRLGIEEARLLAKMLGTVSATYLLCLDDEGFLNDAERALLRCFRESDDRGRETTLSMASFKCGGEKNQPAESHFRPYRVGG